MTAETASETAGTRLWRSGTVVFQRLRSHAVRRIGWGLADQAVSSLTNFAVSIYVARTLGAEQFGAFSLAYVTYGFALNASRGLSTDPLMVRFSGDGPARPGGVPSPSAPGRPRLSALSSASSCWRRPR